MNCIQIYKMFIFIVCHIAYLYYFLIYVFSVYWLPSHPLFVPVTFGNLLTLYLLFDLDMVQQTDCIFLNVCDHIVKHVKSCHLVLPADLCPYACNPIP